MINVLLVEDNPGDVRLTQEAVREANVQGDLYVTRDGVQAMQFLRQQGQYANAPRPDIVLLDINLPRMNGREVLAAIKQDETLRRIPIVVLTTSESEDDIRAAYDLHANCYIVKPMNLDQFIITVRAIESFWLSLVRLPSR